MRVLVTGANGMLARAVVAELNACGHHTRAAARDDLDVTDPRAVDQFVGDLAPDAVVQCAAWTRVDDAETHEDDAFRLNATGTASVASACRRVGARLVYPSTDYVFNGAGTAPYRTDAPTDPVNAYARSKLAGEGAALRGCDALVVRTSWLYGPGGRNFVDTILARARTGAPLRVVDDQHGAPTATPDLARMIVRLLARDAPAGVYHATNSGHTTWFGLASAALELAGVEAAIEPCGSDAFPTPARRPRYSVLDCATTYAITGEAPHWRDALAGVVAS